ncbi:GDSL-type esterase/lipase family protein [Kutzneria sp. 744]|uniref:GDSL-type esterase/lipase family protein n=1 Tax=Kutzneria sp. (strain 744) TaxID=345341 RepID=UPI0003EEA80C|nr:GDSL-type esterase/lipase family protein [Kutzneria sp. 744]EWM19432.1 hypothetical protein KUTG_09736 [Kutzneria sp. 744]
MNDWITTPITADLVRGALAMEPTEHGVQPHRLPARARVQIPDGQLMMAEAQTSGVRLVFRTSATAVELDTLRTKNVYLGAPARPDGLYDLLVDGKLVGQASTTGGNELRIDMSTGGAETVSGPVGTVRFDLPPGSKEVVIWLPYNEITELVALRTDAPVEAVTTDRRIWLHHGSSISHGSNAASGSQTWPALAATAAGVELINLGFGGSAMLDPFTARAIRDTAADVISLKLGINLVNGDVMRLRVFGPSVHGFLDTIREGHPDTPLLVVSPIFCAIHEQTPGPAMPLMDGDQVRFRATGEPAPGKLTLSVIREELARIVKQRSDDDPNLHYLDGRELYAEGDPELPDNLHPDAETHRLMGARFAKAAGGLLAGDR